jgi:hypothetical protein
MVPELVVSSAAQTFFFGWCLVMQVLYACNGQDLKCVWATSVFLGFRVYHLWNGSRANKGNYLFIIYPN